MSKVKIQGNASGTGVVTLTAPNTNTDRTITLPDSTGSILMSDGDGSQLTNLPGGGKVLQVVNYQTGAVATGTTAIPLDDTIPQNTEGDEYMTLAITPVSATSRLEIKVVAQLQTGTADNVIISALFQDTTANAIATSKAFATSARIEGGQTIIHNMVAGTTSATTFKFRAGGNVSATITFNGRSSGRNFGGTMASSITITEYEV